MALSEAERDALIAANIRKARTLRGIPPDQYLVAQRSIGELLDARAQQTPAANFIAYFDDESGEAQQLSYAQFARQVNQMAHVLRQCYGVQRGDRVATLAFNHSDVVCLYFACWKLGATATPQSAAEDNARIAFILNNAGCKVLFAHPEYASRARTLQAQVPCMRHIAILDARFREQLRNYPDEFAPVAENMMEDACLLVYTSGTTGAPKGVMLSQYNLLADAHGMADWQKVDERTRLMCVLPIYHVNGIVVTLMLPLYAGASVVLCRGFKVSLFWRRMAQEGVHIVSVVPTLLQFLCEADEDISSYDLTRLRYIICGAGTLAVSLVARFEERFGVRILHGYGLSEVTAYAAKLPVDLSQAQHRHWLRDFGYPSIGVDFGTNEFLIHDADGNALPAAERGEIVIRGHNVMLGYFQRPDANLETFKHGWFRSGDEGFYQLDEHGRKFFFITGRIKELINRGGVKYSPFEIEEVLLQIPGVKVGLAVAFDNDWYGEEVGAYIVAEEGAGVDAEQVLAHCRAQMPFAKAPKVVKFGTQVPVTTTGKYQRLRLRELFLEHKTTQFKESK